MSNPTTPNDAGDGRQIPGAVPTGGLRSRLTRRGALERFLTLGAAATAAIALPAPVQAAPVVAPREAALALLADVERLMIEQLAHDDEARMDLMPSLDRLSDLVAAANPRRMDVFYAKLAATRADVPGPWTEPAPIARAQPVADSQPATAPESIAERETRDRMLWILEEEPADFLCALIHDGQGSAVVGNTLYGERAIDHAAQHIAAGFNGIWLVEDVPARYLRLLSEEAAR